MRLELADCWRADQWVPSWSWFYIYGLWDALESKRISALSPFLGRKWRSKSLLIEGAKLGRSSRQCTHTHLEPDAALCYILQSLPKCWCAVCSCACQLPCAFLALILENRYAKAWSLPWRIVAVTGCGWGRQRALGHVSDCLRFCCGIEQNSDSCPSSTGTNQVPI